jgi:hypothetical protein
MVRKLSNRTAIFTALDAVGKKVVKISETSD